MHDIRRIREHPQEVQHAISKKGFDPDIDRILALDQADRSHLTETNRLRADLNRASKAIGQAKQAGRDAAAEMESARQIRERITAIEEKQKEIHEQIHNLLLAIPAEPDAVVPEGLTALENREVRRCEHFALPDFALKDHLELGESLGLLDMQRGGKIAGSAFPVYLGLGATLERALINYMLDLHIQEHGYTEVFPPFLVNQASALGTGQLPKLQGDMYLVEKDDLYLIPTSEVPVTNLHRDEVLRPGVLPLKYAAYSACFRREAGAYGADTRGLLRVHQFNKVELVRIVLPEESEAAQEEIVREATCILDNLDITYRVVDLCAGELSFAAARCFDIEVWSPAGKTWLEASSVSNFRDFQARRMNLRFRRDPNAKPEFPHTLNGSALATSRLMVALIESYQTPEGRIRVPKVLQPYMHGIDQIRGVTR